MERSFLTKLVQFREELFRNPEAGWQEARTTEAIRRFLEEHAPELRIFRPLNTGLVVEMTPHPGAPFLALRADIDALEMGDTVRHACGHDVHTTIALGVAALLGRQKHSGQYNWRFIFQPAEEPIPSGAPRMIEAGVLEGVKAVLGMHVDPQLPLGTIGLVEGWSNAQSIRLDWNFRGPGGHSSRPQGVPDPLRTATEYVQQAYRLATRWASAPFPSQLTFTEIVAREGYNVIPRATTLTATLRVTSEQVREENLEALRELNNTLSRKSGVEITWKVQAGSPPVYNDEALTRQVGEIARRKGWKVMEAERSMGGDDFGWYTRHIPGVLVRLGIQEGEESIPLHSPQFKAPSAIIEPAIRFFLNVMNELLLPA